MGETWIPATFKVCPCDLFTVTVNATFSGNCSRLNWKGKLLGIMGIRGIKTCSPFEVPVKTVAFIKLRPNSVIRSLVPLHNLGH